MGCEAPRKELERLNRLCSITAGLLVALSFLAAGQPTSATICATDRVPAATLLLPYFEVDLDNPNGLTTLFSVNNAFASAVLAHVSIWSDLSVPLLNFNVYLTGYDVQTINLRDIIVYGNLPQTASGGQDPTDTISPKGRLSEDINFASCQGQLPPTALTSAFLAHVQSALTGKASPVFDNRCSAQLFGDNIARGYITVDTVNNCTVRFPGDPGYFAPNLTGDVTDQNFLWGTWFIVNTTQNYAQGADLVAIEADGTNPATSTAGRYTFYGRYDNWSADDHREPLATTFVTQFANGGVFSGGTDLLVWRDPKVAQAPFVCPARGLNPGWFPLVQDGLVVFNEQEQLAVSTGFPCEGCPPFVPISFPGSTQRVQVGGASLPLPFNFGWLYLDLNTTVVGAGKNPSIDPLAVQAWVLGTESANGHFAVSLDAYRLDSACAAQHFVPGQ